MRMHALIVVAATAALLAGTQGCGNVSDVAELGDGLVAGASAEGQQDPDREEFGREDARRREEVGDRSERTRDDCEALGLRLREMVANGELTEEEALERYAEACGRDEDRERGRDDIWERIIGALMENGIARENVEGVMETLRPIIAEIESEGEEFELDPAIYDELVGMGLTDEQVEFVVEIARRLADDERGDDEEVDWDSITRRIEGAVEQGELTREEADALYEEIRRRMARESERRSRSKYSLPDSTWSARESHQRGLGDGLSRVFYQQWSFAQAFSGVSDWAPAPAHS